MHSPLALQHCTSALVSNYRNLQSRAGVQVGAAVKADAYGLGARDVAKLLLREGCRDFFVSTWSEASELDFLPTGMLSVLHGFGGDDEINPQARPVLVTPEQVRRWKLSASAKQPCDVMVDTGMSRLGLALNELDCLDGLTVDTLHSHLACAEEDHPLNALQLRRFREARQKIAARRYSLANSAGIYLGPEYAFDLVRPGLALYGGTPCEASRSDLRQVTTPRAQVVQLRQVPKGASVGYNAIFTASEDLSVAVVNIGYADGYRRAFSSVGSAGYEDVSLPVIGRVSMDLVTLDATAATRLREGDWVNLDFNLQTAAAQTGISQYELLTGLGRRYQRYWV